jgi:hypothetical protein
MPQHLNITSSTSNGVYEIVKVDGANAFIAIAAVLDGSNNPVWQLGTCNDYSGNGFVSVFEVNCVTGVVKVNNVQLVVP